jgi:hypothetical protein
MTQKPERRAPSLNQNAGADANVERSYPEWSSQEPEFILEEDVR